MYKEESFRLGESFHRVACDMIPDDWIDNDEDDGHWFVPSIVNMSFACELYFKSLLSDGNSETKGHYLNDLFEKLNTEQKNCIINHPRFKGDDDFYSNLVTYKRMFEDWRYCFEKGKNSSVDLVFLENLALVLHEVTEHDLNKYLSTKAKGLPPLLFKYKAISKPDRIADIFNNNQLYFPDRDYLNDPFEGIKTEIKTWGFAGISICTQTDTEYSFVEKKRREYRILSLSETCFSPLMWAHYAAQYKGLCLCYRTDKSFNQAKRVEYIDADHLPKSKVIDSDEELTSIIEEDYLKKHSDWAYEKEWRILRRQSPDYYNYESNELVAVIWGHNVPTDVKTYLKDRIPAHVKQYQTYIGSHTGRIRLIQDGYMIPYDGSCPDFLDTLDDLYNHINDFE